MGGGGGGGKFSIFELHEFFFVNISLAKIFSGLRIKKNWLIKFNVIAGRE